MNSTSASLKHLCTLLALVASLAAVCQSLNAAEAKSAVDWEKFLVRHDLVWDTLPKNWEGGAFIGNGLLGAMIYSDGTNALQWDVGRSDVTDKGDRIAIGRFILQPGRAVSSGTMRLDLWNAEARGSLKMETGSPREIVDTATPQEAGRIISRGETRWRSFSHAKDLVNVIELTEPLGSSDEPIKIIFQHLPANPARAEYQNTPIPDDQKNPEPTFGHNDYNAQWCVQPFKAGGGYVVAWVEKPLSPGHRLFLFTVDYVKTGMPTPDKAIASIDSALSEKIDDLVVSHRAWWHAYFPQSFLSIPDTRMESFYWIQMYKLASGTRADRPALDLMGPWFRRTPWPHLWWNLNIQLTYWPVYAANRLALGESLTRMIDANRQNLINNVPVEWRSDSAAIGRSSPYNCVRSVTDGTRVSERGDLTWALHNYWLQYRYSGDEKLLRDGLYPILKQAIGYYLHLLMPGEDGKLHLPVSTSPEYPQNAPDTNYDLSLLRWGLHTLLAINERLKLNDPLADKWRETLAKLTPFPVDEKTGYMIGAGQPLAVSHRHFSHLLMVYPLHVVDPESPADKPLIEKSLDHWHSMPGALRGYSFTGGGAISAWVGRKNDVVPMLDKFLEFRPGKEESRYAIKPNTMYTEAGPVIETPLAGAATIHEMVLQSWSMETFGTHMRVFPAVPDSWKDVSFDKLLAEGAFEVSAVRQNGKTKFVQIKSLAGAPCRVGTSLAGKVVASGSREFKVTTETENGQPGGIAGTVAQQNVGGITPLGQPVTVIDLKKGETVLLTSADEKLAADDLTIKPVAAQTDRLNFYGSPKATAK
jgi:alpha-L-fucosidase 2